MTPVLMPTRYEMEQVVVSQQAELGEQFRALRPDAGNTRERLLGKRVDGGRHARLSHQSGLNCQLKSW